VLPVAGLNVIVADVMSRVVEKPVMLMFRPPVMRVSDAAVRTGTALAIAPDCEGAGDGVTLAVPAVTVALTVMLPATVPVLNMRAELCPNSG